MEKYQWKKEMKIKLIMILMSFSIMTWADTIEKNTNAWDPIKGCLRTEKAPYPFDFTYTFNATNGQQQFSRKITEQERDQFYDLMLDQMSETDAGENERFNRKRPQPKFNPTEKYSREQKIKNLLDECVTLVGPSSRDQNYRLDLQDGDIFVTYLSFHSNDMEYYLRTQPHYLTGRMMKCVAAIYPKSESYIDTDHTSCIPAYELSDFGYRGFAEDGPKLKAGLKERLKDKYEILYPNYVRKRDIKRAVIEKKYEIIYLNVRAAGLLRYINDTYYPKSFLREHADQTGLTKYIQEQETQSGKPLKHDELAKQYFGSYEKWVSSLDQFLDQKTIDLKISTQHDPRKTKKEKQS